MIEIDFSIQRSKRKHDHNVRRKRGEFNAGRRRAKVREVRIKYGLHPEWGMIGPLEPGHYHDRGCRTCRVKLDALREERRAERAERVARFNAVH